MDSVSEQFPVSITSHAMGFFFCWRLLGLIPGGTPFSQLNKGVRDACLQQPKEMFNIKNSGKNVRLATSTNKYSQSSNKICNFIEFRVDTQKRAPVKSKGKHLCQSRKMQPKEEGFGETRRKHLCQTQKCTSDTRKGKGLNKLQKLWPLKEVLIQKTQLTPDKKCEENPRAIPISQVKHHMQWAPLNQVGCFRRIWGMGAV